VFDVAIVCLVLTAVLAYLNHRYVGLPTAIGVMSIALVLSLALVGLDKLGVNTLRDYEISFLSSIDFSDVLMQGMLSILLFAGALHVDLNDLALYKWQVGLLSVCGTVVPPTLLPSWESCGKPGLPKISLLLLRASHCLMTGSVSSSFLCFWPW
jgi:CPA1 family monovalent cation:H+ antiporter